MALQQKIGPPPRPPQKPVVGNTFDIGTRTPIQDLMRLGREYGPIFELEMMGKAFTTVWGQELVNELCNEKRFDKSVRGALKKVREVAGDALFTAYTSEPNWAKAHNILLPNFSDRAMQGYHGAMLDVAQQCMLKWERLNPDEEVDVVRDMTAVTLDTIGLAGFGYRLNSFYTEDYHPFVKAMLESLEIAMGFLGMPFEDIINKPKQRKLDADVAYMNGIVDRIIAERKAERKPGDPMVDLLDYMLEGVDKKSGEQLDDLNIRRQIITFLIAGHETTSGMLSFTMYYLLKNPDVMAKAYEEVDRVLGTDTNVMPTYKQVTQLDYVRQILKESLRMWPTAPAFALMPYKDEVIGGRYFLKARSQIVVLLPLLHRDKNVWGERAEFFDPDHFSTENEAKLPPNSYKPFGNGQRACIGMQFAMQEALLVVGMILQRFRLIDHTNYQLSVKETLTVKPTGLKIRLKPRRKVDREKSVGGVALASASAAAAVAAASATVSASRDGSHGDSGSATATTVAPPALVHGTPLLVLFGSNLGSSEDIARHVAELGVAQGFDVTISWLDDYVGKLPTEGGVVIVTASYNGAPPDNAVAFCKWLQDGQGLAPGSLAGVKYTVFGAGNRNWQSTYQAIPRLIDEKLAQYGAERMYVRGEGDARDDLDAHFQAWKGDLWQTLATTFGIEYQAQTEVVQRPMYSFEVVAGPQPNPLAAAHGATTMRVAANRELQHGDARSTRHLEVVLPPGTTYRTGDHLGVIPSNPESIVERVMRRFDFEPWTYVRIQSAGGSRIASLPLDATVSLRRLLLHYLEFQHVATRKQIATLAEHTRCPNTGPKLRALAADDDSGLYLQEVKLKRKSVLDLLEEFPACEIPFQAYVDMLPLMTPRYYSISSSPLASPDRCSITVAVVREEAFSGAGIFEGICSNHLAHRTPGTRINAFVKDSKSGFHLPDDPRTPIIMVGPGTGLAPFRGFLQERKIRKDEGAAIGPAMLYFGCRHPDEDYLYRDELEAFAAEGVVDLQVAFSRRDERKVYVQHLLANRSDAVWDLLERGAHVYVCGDGSAMEPAVRAAFLSIYREKTGRDEIAAERWITELAARNRYNLDVWAST
jgi:cytochrome P450/NADPH-cytochrome P450 reductase